MSMAILRVKIAVRRVFSVMRLANALRVKIFGRVFIVPWFYSRVFLRSQAWDAGWRAGYGQTNGQLKAERDRLRTALERAVEIAERQAQGHRNMLESGEDIDWRYEQGGAGAAKTIASSIRVLLAGES